MRWSRLLVLGLLVLVAGGLGWLGCDSISTSRYITFSFPSMDCISSFSKEHGPWEESDEMCLCFGRMRVFLVFLGSIRGNVLGAGESSWLLPGSSALKRVRPPNSFSSVQDPLEPILMDRFLF